VHALLEETLRVGPVTVEVVRPADADALIDEARFSEDEFMPYWAQLWPSGLALAEAVAHRDLRDARVVELGCGLGVPSVVAALAGAEVLATDWASEALEATAANARRNGVEVSTLLVDWRHPDALLERPRFDLALCSDVLYEPRNVDALLDLLPRVADEVLLAEPGRQTAAAFFERLEPTWTIGREREVTWLTLNVPARGR
jgi:predicted nicotinamide N-methyase